MMVSTYCFMQIAKCTYSYMIKIINKHNVMLCTDLSEDLSHKPQALVISCLDLYVLQLCPRPVGCQEFYKFV